MASEFFASPKAEVPLEERESSVEGTVFLSALSLKKHLRPMVVVGYQTYAYFIPRLQWTVTLCRSGPLKAQSKNDVDVVES